MKLDPNKRLLIEFTIYEITTILNQLRTSLPEPGNQMTVVNVINKLRKALGEES